jgi:hypothetical protein
MGARGATIVTRDQIIEKLQQGLQEYDFVLAAWLGGSDASGRTDALSDIDLQMVVEDERVEEGFERVHDILETLSPIVHRLRFPDPTWHGHSQELCSLRDADPNHFLDLVVMKRSAPDRFLERERHGDPVVLFDRADLLEPPPLDWTALRQRMKERLAELRARFPLLQPMVTRGVPRGHLAESAYGYQAHTLRPLVDLLRLRYCPVRFDYGPRYLDRDLPDEWRREIDALAYPSSPEQLLRMHARATGHFEEQLAAFDRGEWGIPDAPPENDLP